MTAAGRRCLTAFCDHPYDIAAAESCNPRQVGVTYVPDPCTKAPQCRCTNQVAAGSTAGNGSPTAVEWSVRGHTGPPDAGTLSQHRYSEWLNAKPFRSFRFAEP